MPLNVAAVLNFIPINLWRPLKKFATKDVCATYDLAFKMSTKYTAALLFVLLCLSFANQFVRNIEIDCAASTGVKVSSQGGYIADPGLNDYCWNHETFLVAKALDPQMKGRVTYPGVYGYDKGTDELVRQRYYKYIWLIFAQLGVASFMPYFFWKATGMKKIKPLLNVIDCDEYTEEEQRISFFLETVGFNSGFAWFYVLCKILATLSPVGQWFYLSGFIGQRFKNYGVDTFQYFINTSDPWPNPMDALFPKIAKCEWGMYGFSGDMEVKSAQCQLPMNNITQWSFFLYWYWMALIFIINVASLLYLCFYTIPFWRRYKYSKFVSHACRNDVENLRHTPAPGRTGKQLNIKHKKKEVIHIDIGFGDWLVLHFLEKNMEEWKFRDFIRKMATTQNPSLQLKPILMTVPSCSNLNETDVVDGNSDDIAEHKAANLENEFKNSMINGQIAFQTDGKIDNELKQSMINGMGFKHAMMNESFIPPRPNEASSYVFQLSLPVKIDRRNLGNAKNTKNSRNTKKNKNEIPPQSFGWRAPGGQAQSQMQMSGGQEEWS